MNNEILRQIQSYYDAVTPLYLNHLGPTLQAGLLVSDKEGEAAIRASNLALAAAAGVVDGDRLLDAGCGVCGPAVDIARALNVTIDAVTLSPVQQAIGQQRVAEADLTDRVRVHLGDYHALPFADCAFNKVLFLESAGYSPDQLRLFTEAHRLLAYDGVIYIKGVFRLERSLTGEEERRLENFNLTYRFRAPKLSATVESLQGAGFTDVAWRVLNREEVDMGPWQKALWEDPDVRQASAFGAVHFHEYGGPVPVYFGEVRARKEKIGQRMLRLLQAE